VKSNCRSRSALLENQRGVFRNGKNLHGSNEEQKPGRIKNHKKNYNQPFLLREETQ
jgi:hypothetical protein